MQRNIPDMQNNKNVLLKILLAVYISFTLFSCEESDDKVLINSFSLTKTELTLKVGASATLSAAIHPENAGNKTLIWKSSDDKVAYVDKYGTIYALKEGTAVITATTTDGSNMSASCTVSAERAEQTVFMYMPWSGKTIYSFFLKNISSFETAIENNKGLDGKQFMVFISANESQAHLINISYRENACRRDTIKSYQFDTPQFTSPAGITSILTEMMNNAPAENYAMIIGCHGMGWIPVGTKALENNIMPRRTNKSIQLTRFFGHSSDSKYQTDIKTLAMGIKQTGVKMEYILFDDCYMSNIEVAYELREVADYLIASTCEIMIEGMPYALIGSNLLKKDFKGVCDGFYSYYSSYSTPCGTIAVTDCRETERMAHIMKEINMTYPKGLDNTDGLQKLDGLTPTVFFDFGDYTAHLCTDIELLKRFNEQLDWLVPYKANTDTYYSSYTGKCEKINTFSGLTISDPTDNKEVMFMIPQTEWHKATHHVDK